MYNLFSDLFTLGIIVIKMLIILLTLSVEKCWQFRVEDTLQCQGWILKFATEEKIHISGHNKREEKLVYVVQMAKLERKSVGKVRGRRCLTV